MRKKRHANNPPLVVGELTAQDRGITITFHDKPATARFLIARHACRCGYWYWQPAGRPMPNCPKCQRKPTSAKRISEWEDHIVDLAPIQDREPAW